ncbi:von Willebrand factor, type A [Trichormus variabilis ATCC 29413]|uniref:von Willebrand factor, type A n=2 Tax=Anabaena variabilis TaxID=264691 RepID=Q3ME59_TRIV2|nr:MULTISPECIES: VWA domain-containing protein [Nostocaceae]ABA20727.1 von Willebrand factor, type A [Trichormus variabilis ATCC 29413]MBC1217594.1 VWA domain-containing protein [Trichormus variabilis ARAD]MBC1258645.1 VWA domain-containing protein [Trichormus variabilis V5]MBC1269363.1 VWA domain-containing protein [Trichormus variabilis FSR]MBC1305415.1 VWA domain-containing protein [Trichormus variabilis N2B]
MNDTLTLDEVVEFAENPEPRCPCVLLLDTSGSMQGAAIEALNQGLLSLKDELMKNSIAARRVEIAIITFDSHINVIQDFVTADQFNPPILTAQGLTSMGAGIHKALDMVQERKSLYRANGVAYYRPWVFMITDGEPQGELDHLVEQAALRLQGDEVNKRVAFFSVGVENANMTRLNQIAVRTPLKLKGLNFIEMFVWLSASMSAVSHSQIDEQVALPPIGWGSI